MKKISQILCVLMGISLFSCGPLSPPVTAEPAFNRLTLMPSISITSTPANVFEVHEQVTDGLILMSVESTTNMCVNKNMPISFKIVFHNLTDQPIKLLNDFNVSTRGGNGKILAILRTQDNLPIYTENDLGATDYFFETPQKDSIEVPANQDYELAIKYTLPKEFVEFTSNHKEYKLITPVPGKYLIKFVYQTPRGDDGWKGAISSNQIAICIER